MTDTEMTRLLAEKCMRWRVYESGRGSIVAVEDFNGPRERERILEAKHPWDEQSWFPLSSISDAFQVVEKMGGMWLGPASNGHGWIAAKLSLADYGDEDLPATKYAETAARAICLAAIAALEGK